TAPARAANRRASSSPLSAGTVIALIFTTVMFRSCQARGKPVCRAGPNPEIMRTMHVEAINIGPSEALAPVESVAAVAGKGLIGDRHFTDNPGPGNALTLIEAEVLEDVGLTGAQSRPPAGGGCAAPGRITGPASGPVPATWSPSAPRPATPAAPCRNSPAPASSRTSSTAVA